MRKRVFRTSKYTLIGVIFALAFMFVLPMTFGILVLATNMYEEKSVIVFSVLLFMAIMSIVLFVFFKFVGLFTPIYITDNGISGKKQTLLWSEIKLTGYKPAVKGNIAYYLCIDREYQNDITHITKILRQGFCVLLNENHYKNTLPIILANVKTKVVFYNFDEATELPQNIYEMFAAHNNRVEDMQTESTKQ